MVLLKDILTNKEIESFRKSPFFIYDGQKDLRDLTVRDLSAMALILIGKRDDEIIGEFFLAAEGINILFTRAINFNIPIF